MNKGHLIPPELLEEAGELIEYYDVWLEKFEMQRASEAKFSHVYKAYWNDFYQNS